MCIHVQTSDSHRLYPLVEKKIIVRLLGLCAPPDHTSLTHFNACQLFSEQCKIALCWYNGGFVRLCFERHCKLALCWYCYLSELASFEMHCVCT